VAAPEPTVISPVLPKLDVPELNLRSPLTPLVPALLVESVSDPLVVFVL
jgi:hypothetical protein